MDTCIYCRPFDDQSQDQIKKETEAFARLLEIAAVGEIILVSSDVLIDELEERDHGSSKKYRSKGVHNDLQGTCKAFRRDYKVGKKHGKRMQNRRCRCITHRLSCIGKVFYNL